MLVAGVRHAGQTAQLLKILQGIQLPLLHLPGNGLVKLQRPVVGLVACRSALRLLQVVHHVAAGHDQHAALAQGLELAGQRVVL